jgi:hypothetical protein
MAATIFGFSPLEMKPQPGLSITRSESGGYTATHEIIIKASDFADLAPNFVRGALLSGVDPNVPSPFDEFLKIDTVTFVRTDGDLYTFSVTATGGTAQFENDELAPGVEPTYTLTGQLSDAPFSDHILWQPLSSSDKTLLGMLIGGELTFDITLDILYLNNEANAQVAYIEQLTSPDAIEFAERIQQGKTTYQKAVYTWTEQTEGAQMLEGLGDLGRIAEVRGNPPTPLGTARDWMLTSVSQSQSGELYRTSFEWTLSDRGGWDDFLYGEPPP